MRGRAAGNEGVSQVRSVSTFALLGTGILALFVAFGAGAASADTLCTENIAPSGKCPEGKRLPEGESFTAVTPTGEPAVFRVGKELAEVKCKSKATGKTTASDGGHKSLLGSLETVTFENCVGECGSITAENLAWRVEALAESQVVNLREDPAGPPAVVLHECFGFTCLYEAEGSIVPMTFAGGNPAHLTAVEAVFLRKTGLCFQESKFTALYELTTPKPVWLTALP